MTFNLIGTDMSDDTDHRLTIRASETDLAHLATIGAALRAQGVPFPTRTASIKHALATVAAQVAASAAGDQR